MDNSNINVFSCLSVNEFKDIVHEEGCVDDDYKYERKILMGLLMQNITDNTNEYSSINEVSFCKLFAITNYPVDRLKLTDIIECKTNFVSNEYIKYIKRTSDNFVFRNSNSRIQLLEYLRQKYGNRFDKLVLGYKNDTKVLF